MLKFRNCFRKCSVIGMIHVLPLPGTPNFSGSITDIIEVAKKEALIYKNEQVDGVLIENMHDIPYLKAKSLTPETTAFMTRVATEVRNILPKSVKCGVQVLAGGNLQALAVAQAAELDFLRAEGFVFGHVADEGYIDACAGELLRYRKRLDAENILIFTDIKKKHSSHAITGDISLVETAHAAEFFQSDGIILTGGSTGSPADKNQLKDLKLNAEVPVIIGSGVDIDNIEDYIEADAFIIGSHFKEENKWQNKLQPKKIAEFMAKINKLR
nr:PREDICTED: uncharacterized protein F13E9.13, mitochondrial [Bemisia tabaci]